MTEPALQSPADDPQGEVVACVAYLDGRRAAEVPIEGIGAYVGQAHSLLWIGLKDPRAQTLERIARGLSLDRQVCEELLAAHRRPKIVDFDSVVMVVAATVEADASRSAFGATVLLIGKGFLLTIRRGASADYRAVRARLEALPELLARGADFVASELLDLVVDRYVQATTRFEALVEGVEQQLMLYRDLKNHDIQALYRLRRDLLRVHTAIAPLAEICRRLSRVEMAPINAAARPYFGEVADRVLRVDELINALREALAFAFEAGLMIGQMQQTETTRRLASWAAILAVPTAVAGIYGMNFEFMPELKSPYGYPAVLGGMALACGWLYWRLRKAGWL